MPFRLLMTVPDSIANLHFPYHTVMISGNNNGGESRSSSAESRGVCYNLPQLLHAAFTQKRYQVSSVRLEAFKFPARQLS